MYRKSAKSGLSPQLSFVIPSAISRSPEPAKGKNHSPQHNAERRGSVRSKERQDLVRVPPILHSFYPPALPFAFRVSRRGVPARGGYPLHSPLSHNSTHTSPPRMRS